MTQSTDNSQNLEAQLETGACPTCGHETIEESDEGRYDCMNPDCWVRFRYDPYTLEIVQDSAEERRWFDAEDEE